jgi:hypothetical protein
VPRSEAIRSCDPRDEVIQTPSYVERGAAIRREAKQLVLEFMRTSSACQPGRGGLRLAEIFRECGFDWGNYSKATSSNQQYWVVAPVRGLKA